MHKQWKRMIPLCAFVLFCAAFGIYAGIYSHAEPEAEDALRSDGVVTVTKTYSGWFFDGPSADDLFVFYPGGKVEETAYAPLLRRLAAGGMDVFLVRMQFRLALFGKDRADEVFARYDHANRWVGGHSMGGAFAAIYAAGHGEELAGVILLAAYPTKPLDSRLALVSVYGSEDGVLNMEKVAAGRRFAPERYTEYVIEGGNHAQFGCYGEQAGDGVPRISAEEQREQAAEAILGSIS